MPQDVVQGVPQAMSGSGRSHIDEASNVADLQHDLQHDLQRDDSAETTMTIALRSDCNICPEDHGVTVIKLCGDEANSEVQLVAKRLITILKKQGHLNQVSCVCPSPKETDEGLSGDVVHDGGPHEEEEEEVEEAAPEQQDVSEESLDEDDEDLLEEDDVRDAQPFNDYHELQRRVTLDLSMLSRKPPTDMTKAKVALLAPHMLRPVRKLTNLFCDVDSTWVLQLMYDLAPQLEELQIFMPSKAHLEVMETMPQLSRLEVEYYNEGCQIDGAHHSTKTSSKTYTFKKVPARHCGLRFLKVGHMPKKNVLSLIRAHRKTLEELWLSVGTGNSPGSLGMPENDLWPESCHDLHLKLGRYAEEWSLKRLVLFRWLYSHNENACCVQIHALRQVLLGVDVKCCECDKVSNSDF